MLREKGAGREAGMAGERTLAAHETMYSPEPVHYI